MALNQYKFKIKNINAYAKTFEKFLKKKNPLIVKHLKKNNITYNIFLIEWFFTFFGRSFTMNVVTYN